MGSISADIQGSNIGIIFGVKKWGQDPGEDANIVFLPSRFIPAIRHLRKRHAGQFFLLILSMMQSFLPAHR